MSTSNKKISKQSKKKYSIQNVIINNNLSKTKVNTNELISLSNKCNKFEMIIGKYIFNKYIYEIKDKCDENNGDKKIKKEKNKEKNDNSEKKKLTKEDFMNKIFLLKKGIESNLLELKNELKEIKLADEVYKNNPKLYINKKTEFGYPDKFRCNFIRYNKHKYYRCKCKISEDDKDKMFCSRHYQEDNIHINNYIKLKNMVL
tara:strand:- start:13 stop:618 length:606 start_codon:yes stop_codon:yes gene_type:complete